jgi:hypothetical protein
MASNSPSQINLQQAMLKMLKALITLPGQFLYYGAALLAVVAVNSGDLSGILGLLGTTIGLNDFVKHA